MKLTKKKFKRRFKELVDYDFKRCFNDLAGYEQAALENQRNYKPIDLMSGLFGPSGLPSLAQSPPPPKLQRIRGDVSTALVSRFRDVVDQMQILGYRIELWLGRGWFRKSFIVTGDQAALDEIERCFFGPLRRNGDHA